LLDEAVEAKRAAEVAHKITTAHKDDGCDPSGWSANKVLRLPNTVNTSHGFPESVVAEYSGIVYNIMDIEGAYDDVETVERAILGRETSVQVETHQGLPDYADALAKLPQHALEIALAEPKVGPDGNRSEARYKLLCELFRLEGVITQQEALSIAWNAPASRKWSQEDSRGIDGLIAEANKAYGEIQWEKGEGKEPPELDTTESNPDLLEGDEREALKHHRTWVDQYIDWSGRKVAKQNTPYDRINAWTVLSCTFSDMAFIPRKNGPEGLNLYTMT
jgi:hypothetical protein